MMDGDPLIVFGFGRGFGSTFGSTLTFILGHGSGRFGQSGFGTGGFGTGRFANSDCGGGVRGCAGISLGG